MSRPQQLVLLILFISFSALLTSCKSKRVEIASLPEEIEVEQVRRQQFTETAPAYGLYVGGNFQVNIEAEDAPMVQGGQVAIVQSIPSQTSLPCRVSRVLRNVSSETQQGIAWLQPLHPELARNQFKEGDFIFALITVHIKQGALAVPRKAIFIKDAKTWAIEKHDGQNGKVEYKPVEIELGTSSSGVVEVVKGLQDGQTVAVGGAIGYLYPDFKASED